MSRPTSPSRPGRRRLTAVAVTLTAGAVALSGTAQAGSGNDAPVERPSVMFAVANQAAMPQITRDEVLRRARVWVDEKVPYSMEHYHRGHRRDCSGFVSWAWGLPADPNTDGLLHYTVPISKDELKPGDIMLFTNPGPGVGHTLIFEKWTNSARTKYTAYEQHAPRGTATDYREIPYPYFASSDTGPYHPRRYKAIVDSPQRTAGTDVDGDGRADVIARTAQGGLTVYYGAKSRNTFASKKQLATRGFAGYSTLTPIDIDADGRTDLLTGTKTGALYLHRNNGNGGLHHRKLLNKTGWANYTHLAAADMTGDGKHDLLARTSAGSLVLYPNDGSNSFRTKRSLYKDGFSTIDTLLPADVNADGHTDLLARTTTGGLRLHLNNGNGKFRARITLDTRGWANATALTAADTDDDGHPDLLARTKTGALLLYTNNTSNSFRTKRTLYTRGWNSYTTLH